MFDTKFKGNRLKKKFTARLGVTIPPGGTLTAFLADESNHKTVKVDQVGRASGPPAEAHLDILHAQDVPAVVHVLLEVFVLDEREGGVRRVGRLQGHQLNSSTALLLFFRPGRRRGS